MQETDRLMEDMFDVIAAHQTVGWLELVMNHASYSQTVENIFTLSFLVGPRVWHGCKALSIMMENSGVAQCFTCYPPLLHTLCHVWHEADSQEVSYQVILLCSRRCMMPKCRLGLRVRCGC